MKRKMVKIISSILLVASIATITPITAFSGEKNIAYASETDYGKETIKIMVPYLKTAIEKIPVVGDFASTAVFMLSENFFGIKDDETSDKLNEIQEKLDETFNKVRECYNKLNLESSTGNFNNKMTSMRNSVSTILNQLSIIRKAEKELKEITDKESKKKKENEINEYKQNFLETMNNYVTGGDKFNDQIKNIRDYFTGVAAGQNNKGVLTAYYDYNINNNKFYIDAIRTSKPYQDNMITIYSDATYCYLMYLYVKAYSTNNQLIKEECQREINSTVNDYDIVYKKYAEINSKQEEEKFYFNNNPNQVSAIKSVKQIGFCGKGDLHKSIPSDAIDANITKEIMKNFDGSITVREFLKSKGFDIPDSAKYLLASNSTKFWTGEGPYPDTDYYVDAYKLDSNNTNTQWACFYWSKAFSKYIFWYELKEENYNIDCVYFSLNK